MKQQAMLMLIRGMPGSGKSTLAQRLIRQGVIECHYEADQYFVNEQGQYEWDVNHLMDAHDWCRSQAEAALEAGQRVAVSNTSVRLRDIRSYVEMARDWSVLPLRVVTLRSQYGSIHGVPEETMERMRRGFAQDQDILERFGDEVRLLNIQDVSRQDT